MLAAIAELARFGEILGQLQPSVGDHLISFVNVPPELARIESTVTEGACQVMTLKPSDSSNDLLFALRASDLMGRIIMENRGHSDSVSGSNELRERILITEAYPGETQPAVSHCLSERVGDGTSLSLLFARQCFNLKSCQNRVS